MTPVRLQLSRRKGFDLQAHSRSVNGLPAVNVARPGSLGNPFVVGRDGTREGCCMSCAHLLRGLICLTASPSVADQRAFLAAFDKALPTLCGSNLACWCGDGKPCHAGIILLRANLTHQAYLWNGLDQPDALMKAAANPRILLELANP